MTSQLPPVPPGPADTTHGDAYDYVDHAARLLSMASRPREVRHVLA